MKTNTRVPSLDRAAEIQKALWDAYQANLALRRTANNWGGYGELEGYDDKVGDCVGLVAEMEQKFRESGLLTCKERIDGDGILLRPFLIADLEDEFAPTTPGKAMIGCFAYDDLPEWFRKIVDDRLGPEELKRGDGIEVCVMLDYENARTDIYVEASGNNGIIAGISWIAYGAASPLELAQAMAADVSLALVLLGR